MSSKGYVVAVCEDLNDPYICGALHVERDDQPPWIYETMERLVLIRKTAHREHER